MTTVYLALGSNLGDRLQNLRDAVAHLDSCIAVKRVSSVYETEPWGVAEQPKFLNLAIAGETELLPHELLHFVKEIERRMGRTETVRYGPRIIDIDILLYDDLVVQNENLEIPHPHLAERRFVLVPLAEIAPEVKHPILSTTMRELLAQLPDQGDVQVFGVLK